MADELRSARYLAHDWIRRVVKPGDTVVDATLGNGHDACFLAELIGPEGILYGFDIQQEAVDRSRERLLQLSEPPALHLYAESHADMALRIETPVRAVMFNLGWLPGGDKHITTHWESTRQAVESALRLLLPGGILTICAYPGHAEGDRERAQLAELLAALPPQAYNVLHQRFLNAGPGAPECFVIQRQQ